MIMCLSKWISMKLIKEWECKNGLDCGLNPSLTYAYMHEHYEIMKHLLKVNNLCLIWKYNFLQNVYLIKLFMFKEKLLHYWIMWNYEVIKLVFSCFI